MEVEPLWKRREKTWPLPGPTFDIDPAATALVVVDVQRFNCERGVGLSAHLYAHSPDLADYYYDRVEQVVVPNLRRILDAFRASDLRIAFLTAGPELPDGADTVAARRRRAELIGAQGRRYSFSRGSPEHALLPVLAPRSSDLVLNKTSRSPFTTTGFDQSMRNLGIGTLVVVGVITDACVHITAADASDRGFNVIVVADACATFDQSAHDWALADMSVRYAKIMVTDEVIAGVQADQSSSAAGHSDE